MTNRPKDLVINGRFLTQQTTGVQRVARELTRELDHLVAEGNTPLRLRLICEPRADVTDLDLRVTQVERVGGASGHRWEQVLLPLNLRGARLLCLGNTAPLVTLIARRRVALMIHDLSYRLYPEAYTWRYRFAHGLMLPILLRRTAPIITVSETEKAMLSTIAPSAAPYIRVAQNGGWRDDDDALAVDVGDPEGRGGSEEENRRGYMLYVGSFSQRKNWDGVLATAIRLAREDGISTILVGSRGGFLAEGAIEIPDDVALLIRVRGQVESLAELGRLYAGAACLLFPSFYEASPLPPLEAMRFGCPVIGSNIPSIRERCADAAEYCDPYDIDDIVAAVRRVLTDSQRAQRLVEAGYARSRLYSWRAQAQQVVNAILG